jgi:hypothetical protein
MAVNKTAAAGVVAVAAGVGALYVGEYYLPRQAAAAWATGDEKRANQIADSAFAIAEPAVLFVLMILAGLATLATASAA